MRHKINHHSVNFDNTFQSEKAISLRHLRFRETEFVYWRYSRTCGLINGDVVVWGRKSKKSQAEFHVYSQDGRKIKTVKALCAHKDKLNIKTVVIESAEYVAVACCMCTDINLYHLGKETAFPAFSSDYPGPMCHGREGTLFAVNSCKNADKEFDVTEIGCKRMQFTHGQVFETHLKKVPDVCYIPTRDILVLSTHKNPKYRDDLASDEDVSDDEEKKKEDEGPLVIRAVSCKKKKKIVGGKRGGWCSMCSPWDALPSQV